MEPEEIGVGTPGWTARMRTFVLEQGEDVAPYPEEAVAEAERRVGQRLPTTLRELFTEVGPLWGLCLESIQRVDGWWDDILRFVADDPDPSLFPRYLAVVEEGVMIWDDDGECDFWVPSTGAVHRFPGSAAEVLRPRYAAVDDYLLDKVLPYF